ncbi:uncharacterized protein LOC117222724 [Megalopta genalis]|uniref:uncharacterized protein LOC117222724 n=1 Tax=Megalopta genalis TaxID=115081 RepID=UPI003FD36E93
MSLLIMKICHERSIGKDRRSARNTKEPEYDRSEKVVGGGRVARFKGRRLCIKSNGSIEKPSHQEPSFSVRQNHSGNRYKGKMRPINVAIVAIACCSLVSFAIAADASLAEDHDSSTLDHPDARLTELGGESAGAPLIRQKRTILLKKKLLGAGLLGFGLGIAKGYKAGYYTAPSVRHVYLSPPPSAVKYVEYVEKPVFVERIIERPAPFVKSVPAVFSEPSPSYGVW